MPSYSNDVKRNQNGFVEASMLKWVCKKLISGWGHKNTAGIGQINIDEFQTFLFDMKPVLEEFKLWSPTPDTFARNVVLLADLFQNKSNGDVEVNYIELTEFAQMLLSATEIKTRMNKSLATVCDPGPVKDDPAFDTECYNKYFFDTILNTLNYKKNLPYLATYIQNSTPEEINAFLVGVEGFARDLPDPSIPVRNRDNILIIGALLNIESTFIRFDVNRDNVIDYKELQVAFKVYRSAIISLAKLRPDQENYAPSIFYYMASKMLIPPTATIIDNLKFLSFHTCVRIGVCRNKIIGGIEAKRLNIGKLLYYMVNGVPKDPATTPSFDNKAAAASVMKPISFSELYAKSFGIDTTPQLSENE